MNLDLEALGFTKEELQQRVIDQVSKSILSSVGWDDEDGEYDVESKFTKTIQQRVIKHVDNTINALAEKHVLPNVADYIENLTLQATNKWGERTGEKLTFIEYLTQRAEAYMTEKVNHSGKSKAEDSYSWSGTQTRITYLVNQHLHFSIERAMKDALQIANSAISTGIQETVKLKLGEIAQSLKVSVATK
ncbi:hypothetical protein [Burkholderia cepacia]|uniref:hypothetical protein n=1 Tax=Burkholderia cepacia TaxID=292 RepID=UPI0026519349|nr:hypothetical protein [Burkholderia cepacia]MDN7913721.1 hypothetical protein [Burkholderia cepacia]